MITPISYWQRHLGSLWRYGTPSKYLNLTMAFGAYLAGKTTISSMPAFLKVEICRFCDVNCRFCFSHRDDVIYPFSDYKDLIDQFKDYIFLVSLYDIGEPLQNIQVIDYIKYAHQNRVGTVISSSLSLEKDDSFWQDIATSGLDYLIVAIDGVSREVYNYYRRNGKFDMVMSNLKKIISFKKKSRSKLFIEWQMIDFEWNRMEQTEARNLAYEIGCNKFRIIPEASKPRISWDKENEIRNRNCLLPYVLLFVNAYNDVRLCYKIYHHDMCIGSLFNESFSAIWNGNEIARARDRKQIIHKEGCQKCRE